MLAYFPTIYPGELLYSVLARYQRHVGMPGMMHTLDALFGNRKVIASFDLPGHLQTLVDNIPVEHGITINFIIDTLTLYPYFTAFEPPTLQAQVRTAMHNGAIDGLHVRLGLAAFRIGRVSRFRFCIECTQKMLEQYDELYWRRDHQLPSVLVCPEHGHPLQESSVLLTRCSRHEFIAASLDNCPSDANPVLTVSDPTILPHLQRLACSSARLLDELPPARSFAEWTSFYRRTMLELGLARSVSTMNQQQLGKAFRGFYGQVLEVLPSVITEEKFAGEWLAAMVRKHRKANHPLYHLLFQDFLTQQESRLLPFGQGPWPCRNPLAHHYNQLTIELITQHRNHGRTVGVFACSCGYVYTRNWDPITKTLARPRFLRYGPLLEPVLKQHLDSGASIGKVARKLRLNSKTVVLIVSKLKKADFWKNQSPNEIQKLSGTEREVQGFSYLSSVASLKSRQARSKRCNWLEIDAKWLKVLDELAEIVLTEVPPIRLTVSEIERRIGKRGYFGRNLRHLPETALFLEKKVESVTTFQIRRIKWVIEELKDEAGEIKSWKVMKKAGVNESKLHLINKIINKN
jgi:hypothetical protein